MARGSGGRHLETRRDDAQPGGGTGPPEDQEGIIRRQEETTHILGAEQGHERIRRASFGDKKRRRTVWGRNRAARGSGGRHSETRRGNTHAGGGAGWREDQEGTIRRQEETTHSLGAERGHERIRRASLRDKKRRRTRWGRNGVARGSGGCHWETTSVNPDFSHRLSHCVHPS